MECAMTKDERAMYDTMLNIYKRVEIMYETLKKEIKEKEWLKLQLQATEDVMEELKQNKHNLQIENYELNMHVHEEKEEKQSLLL